MEMIVEHQQIFIQLSMNSSLILLFSMHKINDDSTQMQLDYIVYLVKKCILNFPRILTLRCKSGHVKYEKEQ